MEEKKGKLLEILNSKLIIIVLVFAMFFLATILAGNVIVKEGSMEIEEDLNVSGQISITGASRVKITRATAFSVPNAAWTKIPYNYETFDNLGEYDNVVNHRFTAQKAGYYQVNAALLSMNVQWPDATAWQIRLRKNGAAYASGTRDETHGTDAHLAHSRINDIVYLAAGDYVEIFCYQNRGSATSIFADGVYNYFSVHRMS